MTVDDLRAHILAQLAALEQRRRAVRTRPRANWERGWDPVDAAAEGELSGLTEAYEDVLRRLPGSVKCRDE